MSIKIGLAPGNWSWGPTGKDFFEFVDACEPLGWDSLWFTDRLVSENPVLEPVTALAMVAARTQHMKFGTSVLIPALRNPTVLAKELATIDFLSGGRLLPAIGLGSGDNHEYESAGVHRKDRGNRTEEVVHIMRRLWSENSVTHQGTFFSLTDVTIEPKPLSKPHLPIWVGGRSHQAIKRVAQIGDGWLASSATPKEMASGVMTIKEISGSMSRHIEDDHYGVLLPCYISNSRDKALAMIRKYTRNPRPDTPLELYTIAGTADDFLATIDGYVKSGVSKFIFRLVCQEDEKFEQLNFLSEEIVKPINNAVKP